MDNLLFMNLPFAPNFEQYLKGKGSLAVRKVAEGPLPSLPDLLRVDYSVEIDGKEIGVYTTILDTDGIIRQSYDGMIPGYTPPKLIVSGKRYVPSTVGLDFSVETWRDRNPQPELGDPEGILEHAKRSLDDKLLVNSHRPKQRKDGYSAIPFP